MGAEKGVADFLSDELNFPKAWGFFRKWCSKASTRCSSFGQDHLQIPEVVATDGQQAHFLRSYGKSAALKRSSLIHKAVYGFALRRAREGASWLPGFGSPLPQLLRSSLGAPAGGVLAVLSMQGIALRYS